MIRTQVVSSRKCKWSLNSTIILERSSYSCMLLQSRTRTLFISWGIGKSRCWKRQYNGTKFSQVGVFDCMLHSGCWHLLMGSTSDHSWAGLTHVIFPCTCLMERERTYRSRYRGSDSAAITLQVTPVLLVVPMVLFFLFLSSCFQILFFWNIFFFQRKTEKIIFFLKY